MAGLHLVQGASIENKTSLTKEGDSDPLLLYPFPINQQGFKPLDTSLPEKVRLIPEKGE
jgi:hypothetical protein